MESLATTSTRAGADGQTDAAHRVSVALGLVAFGLVVVGPVALAVIVGTMAIGVAAALVPVVTVGLAAAFVDARSGRIPDQLVAVAAVAALAGAITVTLVDGPEAGLVRPLLGMLAAGGPLLAAHLVSPSSIGFGDVKLAAVTGVALGLVDPRLALLALCVATGTTAVSGLVTRRSEVPLGPGIVLGAIVVLLPGTVWS